MTKPAKKKDPQRGADNKIEQRRKKPSLNQLS